MTAEWAASTIARTAPAERAKRAEEAEHVTVEHLLGARPGHERAQTLEERVGAHREPARAPRALALEGHLVGRQEAEASIRQRGPDQEPAEIRAALAVVTAHLGGGLEVEATHTGFAFPAGLAVVVGVGALGSVLVCAAARDRAREREREGVLRGASLSQGPAFEARRARRDADEPGEVGTRALGGRRVSRLAARHATAAHRVNLRSVAMILSMRSRRA